jgi:hypothetical protein
MVLILKPQHIYIERIYRCGDGCCSWGEWESECVLAGEEYEDDKINIEDLVEGVDYKKYEN